MTNYEPITVVFFSCRRLEMLNQAVKAFLQFNTYPIADWIIANDSADKEIHKKIEYTYKNAWFVFHEENGGLFKSIDLTIPHIETEYYFLCEDDWTLTRKGFIEKSLAIMKERPEIEEVWPQLFNIHDAEPEILEAGGQKYRLVTQFHLKGQDGPYGWHGFSTACSLKRVSDYWKVAPYDKVEHVGTVWQHEQAIGEKYRLLGYRTAVMAENYAVSIGYGKSEYKPGSKSGGAYQTR